MFHESIQKCSDNLDLELKGIAKSVANHVEGAHMLSKEEQQKRFEAEITNELLTLKRKVENGASVIMQSMPFTDKVADDVLALMNLINAKTLEYLQQVDEGKTLLELSGASIDTFEKMYQVAKELYAEKQFEKSADAFGFLVLVNSESYGSWLGLGNSQFYLKRYEEALFAYAWCYQENPADPTCHILSSRCYEGLNELDNAINALDLALLVIGDEPEYQQHKAPIMRQRQRLQTKLKVSK